VNNPILNFLAIHRDKWPLALGVAFAIFMLYVSWQLWILLITYLINNVQ
jgi:hypothetical protein